MADANDAPDEHREIDEEEKRQISELKEVFDHFDQDHSGNIDAKELKHLLKCLGENPVEAEIQDMIAALDKDNSGTIDWVEFAEMMMAKRGKVSVDDEID
jgi:Ca2+-binding EF-hand superfamily protein